MGIPAIQTSTLAAYILKQKLTGRSRYPLVLMLEPLFQCNLRCKGCGKVDYPPDILNRLMSVEECVDAAMECGAPVVSIPGGEPLLHPEIPRIVEELVKRRRFVYLCTNAQIAEKRLAEFTPSPYLTFSVHLDGLAPRHDAIVCKEGAFDIAVAAVREMLRRGFRVTTNTTFFKGDTPRGAAMFFDFLTGLGVEGMTISAAFSYESAADQSAFMARDEATRFFREVFALGRGRRWSFNQSGLYLDFLAGNRDYVCTPWGSPARNVFGWQRPCYLLDDGFAGSFRELMETTPWERYGKGRDSRCAECMVHCGYEPSAVKESASRPWEVLRVALRGAGS